jgi:hypothetical protein
MIVMAWRERRRSYFKVMFICWPDCMVIVMGMASKPGTRLKVRSLGIGAKPFGALVWTVRVPLGLVMLMVWGSGWAMGSLELEMTGRMNWSGDWEAVSTVAVMSRLDCERLYLR